ncbi:MAG: hypothetical protein IJ757_06980 [Clostridiales bacterium]|nr:hypothetical protein [Clostridiales bacterium]
MNTTNKYKKYMYLVIPAMLLCMIGDYCIGIEPAGSEEIGLIASSGWVTISDLRITISNICGMIGTFFYAVGAISYIKLLLSENKDNNNLWDQRFLKLFYISLFTGCLSFIYFHIACGGLIQHFNVLMDATGDFTRAEELLLRTFMIEAVPFVVLFVLFDVFATVAWIALVVRGVIPAPKVWLMAAPLLTALIGQIIELIPLPFNGIGSGFESLGWMLMFVAGIRYVGKRS